MSTQTNPISIHSLNNELLASIASGHKNTQSTGFTELDIQFGGIAQGDLVVIGARPGMGKTQFAVNLISNIYHADACLYFSLAQSIKNVTARFVACKTGIEAHKLQGQQVSSQEHELIQTIRNNFEKAKLWISEVGHHNFDAILATTKDQANKSQIKVVVIDDLQEIISSKTKSTMDTQISEVLQQLKQMAKALNIAVIVLSKLSRAVEKRTLHIPKLSDFMGDNTALASVDKVWLLYRPEYYAIATLNDGTPSAKVMQLIIAKNNAGKEGIAHFKRDENFTRFTVVDPLVFRPIIKS